ncbi:MAG: UDP-3-O-acyl-N-acetylglucosamine deacetylase [Deltaproteobacteria bacterium]|nr:UDP-3-O-acyl-N-acetylglucosamine deacetylase [Deltaproteobacteria bacterium]
MTRTALRLVREFRLEGRGVHDGEHGSVRVRPGRRGQGWRAGRGHATVAVRPELAIIGRQRSTAIRVPGGAVRTVEHLLAALAGCGVRDVVLEFEGPEVPILDGSARPWVEAIRENAEEEGTESGRASRKGRALRPARGAFGEERALRPAQGPFGEGHRGEGGRQEGVGFRMRCEGATYRVEPAERFSAVVEITGPYPRLGVQRAGWDGEPGSFARDVAPARTFALLEEVAALRAAGLAKGGGLDCAVVLGPDGPLGGPLRFPDEPVRHKLLDLIGDVALLGTLPPVRIAARAPFHEANRVLATALGSRSGYGPVSTQNKR